MSQCQQQTFISKNSTNIGENWSFFEITLNCFCITAVKIKYKYTTIQKFGVSKFSFVITIWQVHSCLYFDAVTQPHAVVYSHSILESRLFAICFKDYTLWLNMKS